ncbi:hypothetical protein [Mycolicibacter minnesotensis]
MRALTATLLWLLATVSLAVALPTAWAQCSLIDGDGYARLAGRAAAQPALQEAVAAELSAQTMQLIRGSGFAIDPSEVGAAARKYTAGRSFPAQFVQVNRDGHDWLLNVGDPGPWEIDIAPMLRDKAFAQLLSDYPVLLPATLTVPLTSTSTEVMRPAGLHRLAVWGPLLSVVLAAIAGLCAVLTLVAAQHRGRALAGLGVSALLVGAGGWAAIEVGRRYLDQALNQATGDIRRIAAALVDVAQDSLHLWLNLALAAGGAMVLVGVAAALLGGRRKS